MHQPLRHSNVLLAGAFLVIHDLPPAPPHLPRALVVSITKLRAATADRGRTGGPPAAH
jgi:hypothetical protein